MTDLLPPRLLLVGGGGGRVGRAVLLLFSPAWWIRSVHRRATPGEARQGVEWIPADIAAVSDWGPLLEGVDCVLNVAWYRWTSARAFARLRAGLVELVRAAERLRDLRFLHVSVPEAPPEMERSLPYLREKRVVDATRANSGLSNRIVRPTMLYAPGDRLLGVMLRLMDRYHRFPMFGDGSYHVSPLAAADLASILRQEAAGSLRGTIDLGGPVRYRYRELTDRMFRILGRTPKYFALQRRGALRLAGLMVALGSTLIYPYEIDWLMSDRLGLPPYGGLDRPLQDVAPYLQAETARLRRRASQAQV